MEENMQENRVDITVEEYHELLRVSERVAVIERILRNNRFIADADLKLILDISDGV